MNIKLWKIPLSKMGPLGKHLNLILKPIQGREAGLSYGGVKGWAWEGRLSSEISHLIRGPTDGKERLHLLPKDTKTVRNL